MGNGKWAMSQVFNGQWAKSKSYNAPKVSMGNGQRAKGKSKFPWTMDNGTMQSIY
jgi:hypothetical protein